MKAPNLTLKYAVQRYSAANEGNFDPKTFMDYVDTFPTYGLGIGWEATYDATTYLTYWYKGALIDRLDVDFTVDSFIMATVKLMAQSVTSSASLITAASRASNPIDLTNSYCLPLTGHDAEVFINAAGGADSTNAKVKRVHFSIQNNLKRIPVIQTSNPELLKYIVKSQRKLEGEIELYVEDKTEYDYLLAATALDIRIDLQKTDNSPYFDFTGCKIDMGSFTTRINEVPCFISLPFKATGLSVG